MAKQAAPREYLIELVKQGHISVGRVDDALVVTKVRPDGSRWEVFLERLLLGVGGLAMAFSILFFIAFNWSEMGRFAKFALVEALIVLAFALYWRLGSSQIVAGRVALFVAAMLVGVLLALFGQIYQTGADSWQLFFSWALLILPWVLIARIPALWVLWFALVNLSIVLYVPLLQGAPGLFFDAGRGILWSLFLCNISALALWEVLARKRPWMSACWVVRLLALGGGVSVTWLVLLAIFDTSVTSVVGGTVWGVWLAVFYLIYRKRVIDLFMLAGGALSVIVIVVSFVSRHMVSGDPGGDFLFIALLVVGLGSGAAVWLKKIHLEQIHETGK